MSQSDAIEFRKYLENFPKNPILPEQTSTILCLMINGTINKNGAVELFKYIIKENMKKYHEFLAMNEEQILELIEEHGV